MLSFNILVTICLAYVAMLFGVAALAERRARKDQAGFLQSPLVYTLSISVYCTAWTFYGAVGSAARSGLEFLAIYVGPTLVFLGWWWLLRKLVRIGRTQRITSIADLISSRYGKSNILAVIVTLLSVIGTTPYIALQLQSLTLSFSVFTVGTATEISPAITALIIALGLASFTIVFGTRNVDANERHHGVVTAIALEAVVKLIALLGVGIFVVWGVSDGPSNMMQLMQDHIPQSEPVVTSRWVTLTFLSATAIICLPRMFQVVVVENSAERHLATASWAFPLYLLMMCIFVLPIAVTGLAILPEGSNPDLFVLTVPLSQNQNGLATLAFLGGFSSATSMVIVAAIALSTMMSNHIVLPFWLYSVQNRNPESDDVRTVLLRARRVSIAVILSLGYLYYRITGGTDALASIGLIAFLGVAQILPALIGGLFWHNATRSGAMAGILVGFTLWAYTLFLPSFNGGFGMSVSVLNAGPFGIEWLRPQSLLGISISDPLIHALFWSLTCNTLVFILGSLASNPQPLERLQAQQFINVFGRSSQRASFSQNATPEDLFVLAQRILGRGVAAKLFDRVAREQGKSDGLPDPTNDFVERLEKELAGSVGAATAHAMVGRITGQQNISVEDLIAVADETAQIMEYSAKLEVQSKELTSTAEQLRSANQKLTELGQQKDDFLSQVSHELRTPMTSIRSFAEILRSGAALPPERMRYFSGVIHDESKRLTRLLDEILDLSFLESGKVRLNIGPVSLKTVLDNAILASQKIAEEKQAKFILNQFENDVELQTDADRLSQVFINLLSNSIKYSDKQEPELAISVGQSGGVLTISFSDDGPGIPNSERAVIFEKFQRLTSETASKGVGLGLPISREIMRNLGGDLICVPSKTGAEFRVTLPVARTS